MDKEQMDKERLAVSLISRTILGGIIISCGLSYIWGNSIYTIGMPIFAVCIIGNLIAIFVGDVRHSVLDDNSSWPL